MYYRGQVVVRFRVKSDQTEDDHFITTNYIIRRATIMNNDNDELLTLHIVFSAKTIISKKIFRVIQWVVFSAKDIVNEDTKLINLLCIQIVKLYIIS